MRRGKINNWLCGQKAFGTMTFFIGHILTYVKKYFFAGDCIILLVSALKKVYIFLLHHGIIGDYWDYWIILVLLDDIVGVI